MPSVTYMNQSAPFWDFIASLEQQGNNSARVNNNANTNEENRGEGNEHHQEGPPFDPFGWGNFFGGRAFAHHGPPPHHHEEDFNEKDGEKNLEKNDEEMRDDNDNDNGEGPSCNSGSDNEGHTGRRGHHGRCGGRRRGRCDRSGGPGSFGGPWGWGGRHGGPPHRGGPWGWGGNHEGHHHGPGPHHGPHHGGPRGFGRRGGWGGPWGGRNGHPFAAAFDPSTMLTNFITQFQDKPNDPATETDHTPEADIFDTETSYVIHISLPGAKKEDVGVNWDAEKSELSIAGVIYRPGDEEFLKTLAMNERKVGPFERKIRLGTRATPAHIDVDGISAKLEDGILRVEVPKLDSGYVEVRKVDIE